MRWESADRPDGYNVERVVEGTYVVYVVRNPDGKLLRDSYLTPERASSAARRSSVARRQGHSRSGVSGRFVAAGRLSVAS